MQNWTRVVMVAAVCLSILGLGQCTAMPDGSYEVNVNIRLPDGGLISIGGPVVVGDGSITFTPHTGGAAGAGGEAGSSGTAGAAGAAQGGQAGSAGAGGATDSNACGGPFSGKHAVAMPRISSGVPAYATPDFTYPNTQPSHSNDEDATTR